MDKMHIYLWYLHIRRHFDDVIILFGRENMVYRKKQKDELWYVP